MAVRGALPLLAIAHAARAAAAANTSVMLSRCASPSGFTPPSPDVGNASSSSGAVVPWSGLPYINMTYNYSGGGWVASLGSDFPQPLALFFSVYNPLAIYY